MLTSSFRPLFYGNIMKEHPARTTIKLNEYTHSRFVKLIDLPRDKKHVCEKHMIVFLISRGQ